MSEQNYAPTRKLLDRYNSNVIDYLDEMPLKAKESNRNQRLNELYNLTLDTPANEINIVLTSGALNKEFNNILMPGISKRVYYVFGNPSINSQIITLEVTARTINGKNAVIYNLVDNVPTPYFDLMVPANYNALDEESIGFNLIIRQPSINYQKTISINTRLSHDDQNEPPGSSGGSPTPPNSNGSSGDVQLAP